MVSFNLKLFCFAVTKWIIASREKISYCRDLCKLDTIKVLAMLCIM